MMDTPGGDGEAGGEDDAERSPALEAEAWEDFLDMTIRQCGVWAGENIEPDKQPFEIMPTEPYLLGSHSGCAGIWVSGPTDIPGTPKEWSWGNRIMTTVKGLFTAGDGVGASGHKFSFGFARRRPDRSESYRWSSSRSTTRTGSRKSRAHVG